jgi:hypothetical protein
MVEETKTARELKNRDILKRATHHHLFIVVTRNYSMTIMPTMAAVGEGSEYPHPNPIFANGTAKHLLLICM